MSFTAGIGHGGGGDSCFNTGCPCKNMVTLSLSVWSAAQIGDEMTLRRKTEKNRHLLSQFDEYGYTPLHYAAQNGYESIVRYLLSHNVPVNAEKCGATALHRAAYGGNFTCVKLLVEAGADVNAVDNSFGDLNTAAHKALLAGRKDIAEYLLSQGAKDNVQNARGYTVRYLLDHPKELDELLDLIHGNNISASPIIESSERAPTNLVQLQDFPLCSKCNLPSMAFTRNSKGLLICSKCKFL